MLNFKKNIKKRLFGLSILGVLSFLLLFNIFNIKTHALAPSFTEDIGENLINTDGNKIEENGRMFKRNINKDYNIKKNILNLFYPDVSGNGGQIWEFLRIIVYALIVGFLIYYGFLFIYHAEEGSSKAKEHMKNIVYILIGGAIILLSTRILGSALDIGKGSEKLISGVENNLFFQILSFLKGFAFFLAIIFLIRNGYTMMMTTDGDEKITKGKNGILAVIISLIFIKIIDYLYYIAQTSNFKEQATELIIQVSKILGYVLGSFAVFMLFYGGFRLITDGGQGEGFNTFKKVIIGTFISAIVIFLFLLIMYQVIQEFA